MSVRATDLGIAPAKAIELAVSEYNAEREKGQPKINLFLEDDQWEKKHALPAYTRLRKNHNINVIFMSNTDGTVALQDKIVEDRVICINPLNSDELLSSLNRNTFKIAKRTEETNGLVAVRIAELGYKNVAIMHYPNDFMTRGAMAAKTILDESLIENQVIQIEKGQVDYQDILMRFKDQNVDAYIMFGYKEFGFAMKQARSLGIDAPFFGSTTLLDPEYFTNSEGLITGSVFPFFTPTDGNYVLATEFLNAYELKFGERPFSVWPPMQAYDASNLVLSQLRNINETKRSDEAFDDWLRKRLHAITYHQGICGNLSVEPDGSSKGIYFSLYKYVGKGEVVKVRR